MPIVSGSVLLAFAWATWKYVRDEYIRKNVPVPATLVVTLVLLSAAGVVGTVYGLHVIAHHGER